MTCRYFGTDGIRDQISGPLMNHDFIRRLGFALGRYLEKQYPDQPRALVIARDTRESGEAIEKIIAEGLSLRGVIIYCLGVVPTPAAAMAVIELNAQLGLVITASHNPAEYNGIKLFNAQGHKLTEEEEEGIEILIDQARPPQDRTVQAACYPHPFQQNYTHFTRSLMHKGCLTDWKIVLDTANGATTHTSPHVLRHLGAEVIGVGNEPNGENINEDLGSEHPEVMAKLVTKHKARLGAAHDGDGDRLIVADEKGSVLDGDEVLGILALDMLQRNCLKGKTLVTTVLSNKGLDKAVEAAGGKVIRAGVGDRHVLYRMLQCNSNLGGEASGHIICKDFASTGDGLIALLRIVDIMNRTHKPLSSLRKQIKLLPAVSKNIKLKDKRPLETLSKVQSAIKAVDSILDGNGQVLVRYSGTEPKIRLRVEAKSQRTAKKCILMLEEAVGSDLELAT